MSTCPAERQNHGRSGKQTAESADALRKEVHLGLQICRANSLSLTRLQLALRKGDRQCVLEAVDKLHDLDSQICRLLKKLPVSANDDPDLQEICKHVDDQSIAVAFEKLALVSEVSGPGMVSPSRIWDDLLQEKTSSESDPDQPVAITSIPYQKVLSLALALVTFTALSFAIVFFLAA